MGKIFQLLEVFDGLFMWFISFVNQYFGLKENVCTKFWLISFIAA